MIPYQRPVHRQIDDSAIYRPVDWSTPQAQARLRQLRKAAKRAGKRG